MHRTPPGPTSGASQASETPGEIPPLAVIDIDGVVADVRHRVHFLDRRPRDWDAFFAAAEIDPPLPVGLARVQELAADHEILWLTGRPERLRETTVNWLARHDLPPGRLIMRGDTDRRPARIVKRAELRRLKASRQIAVVIDDDPAVVATLAGEGWPVEQADWVQYAPELGTAQEKSGRT